MKRMLPWLMLTGFTAVSTAAPIALGPGTTFYTQDFDSLAVANNNAPAATTWTDDSTLPGWWLYRAGNSPVPPGLAGAGFTYYVSDGTAAPNISPLAHGFYSLGIAGSTDRSLGSSTTTDPGELSSIVIFQNTAPAPLKLSRVRYTGEAQRSNSTAGNRESLFVWWRTGNSISSLTSNTTALVTGNSTVFADGTTASDPTGYYISGWTHLTALNFTNFNVNAGVPLPPETQLFDVVLGSQIVIPPGEFLGLRWSSINDGGTDAMLGLDNLTLTFEEAPPGSFDTVSATDSPQITFTRSANGDAAYPLAGATQTGLGWTGGTAGGGSVSNVQTQPNSGAFTGTNKYWHLTASNTTFTTHSVDVSALAGHQLEGRIELGFYSTSATGLESADVLNARLEVAIDGNFTNLSAGNILRENIVDEPGSDTDVFDDSIAIATTYINLSTKGFPDSDFIFHPFVTVIPIPARARNPRARIIFASGTGITNSEHILLDNVGFSQVPDMDGDGMTDTYEGANGLSWHSSLDRDTDLDADGQTNYQEFISGTAANNPSSLLHIISSSISPAGTVSLSWSSVAGKRYQVQVSTSPGRSGPWVALGSIIAANGSTASLPGNPTLPAGVQRHFLRVSVVP